MIKVAFFDLDGTLLDSNKFVYSAFDYVLKKNNYPLIPWSQMAKLMGLELDYIYSQFAPDSNAKALAQEHINFQKDNLMLVTPFPGAIDVVKTIATKNIHLAAITSRSNVTTHKSLALSGLLPFFELVYTLDDVTNPKPNPEAINKALKVFSLDASEAIMIGDTQTDILTGKNAAVVTIGATYGMHGENIRKSNPDFIINDITEVLPIIAKLN
jgi:pyrophosphatase PpaX